MESTEEAQAVTPANVEVSDSDAQPGNRRAANQESAAWQFATGLGRSDQPNAPRTDGDYRNAQGNQEDNTFVMHLLFSYVIIGRAVYKGFNNHYDRFV